MISQNQQILRHLRKYNGITTLVAFRLYGITRLASRISELRKMGYDITALNHEVSGSTDQVTFRFRDGRVAAMTLHPKFGFNAVLTGKGEIARVAGATNCFPNLIGTMLKFFNDRTEPFDRRETIAIAALVRAGIEASARSGEWVSVDTL